MPLIEPNGRPYVLCPKCKTNVVWPASLTAEEKSWLASEVRSDTRQATTDDDEHYVYAMALR
mgnify:CR=1 FL=1